MAQGETKWGAISEMRLPLSVRIPAEKLKLRALRKLAAGDVIPSSWQTTDEVPLQVGGAALSWCEFASVDGKLAVRLTRLEEGAER